MRNDKSSLSGENISLFQTVRHALDEFLLRCGSMLLTPGRLIYEDDTLIPVKKRKNGIYIIIEIAYITLKVHSSTTKSQFKQLFL